MRCPVTGRASPDGVGAACVLFSTAANESRIRREEGYYVASVPQLPGCATLRRGLWTRSRNVFERRSNCALRWRARLNRRSNSWAFSESALQHEPQSASCRARLDDGAGKGRFRCGPHQGAVINFSSMRTAGGRSCLCIVARCLAPVCCTRFFAIVN